MANKGPFPEFDFKWPNFDQSFWDRFSVPGIDTSALMESQKKNFDALVKANQKAAEGYQNLMRRQAEIMTETMQAIQESVGDLMKANEGKDVPKKQAELVEKTIGRAFKHMKELAQLTIDANGDAFKVMQDRAKESISEMQALAEKISSGKK
ncbi:MAG: phasin family protein [Alphaproteobacteria bacterium]|nr:phasin family protein [Alphaproteobacteria bacterium]